MVSASIKRSAYACKWGRRVTTRFGETELRQTITPIVGVDCLSKRKNQDMAFAGGPSFVRNRREENPTCSSLLVANKTLAGSPELSTISYSSCFMSSRSIPTNIDSRFMGSRSIRGHLDLFCPGGKTKLRMEPSPVGSAVRSTSRYLFIIMVVAKKWKDCCSARTTREGLPPALRPQTLIGRGSRDEDRPERSQAA